MGLLAGTPAFAGSFNTDFSTIVGYSLAGSAYITNQPSNRLSLTQPVNSQNGGITLDDLDAGQAIQSFTATFKLQLGPGSGNPADGVSFNFGPGIYVGEMDSEEGPGGTALTIEFDTYDNGGGEAPALDIRFGGVEYAHHPFNKSDMVTSQLEDVSVELTKNGKVSVGYKGQIIHTNVFIPGWAPTFGMFNFSAKTGGENEEQDVAQLSITTVLQGADVAPTILTNPASVTVNERSTTNFSVVVDGTAPFTFQWTDNGTDIAAGPGIIGETTPTLTMGPIPYTENGHQIRVRVSNPANPAGITSAAAVLTVIRDTTPPTVVSAHADGSGTQVTVVYSEPVSDSVLDYVNNYGITPGITISGATRSSDSSVVLTTSQMPGGQSFTLSIHGVQDTASTPNTMAPTQVTFSSYLFQAGSVIHKKYTDPAPANGTSFATLQADPRYPSNPDRQDIMAMFEYPVDGNGRDATADPGGGGAITYSDTLECYFIPPTTNDYVFYASGADLNDVYLSTDTDPANMHNIAQESGWTNPRQWLQYDPAGVIVCGSSNGQRSDWYTGNTTWPGAGDPNVGAASIHLDGGQRYYLLAFHHRDTWSGADDFAVTYSYSNSPPAFTNNCPVPGAAPLLTGSVIGALLDPTGAAVTFSQQPADVTILQGRKATFTALATGHSSYGTNVVYQWQTAPSGSTTFTIIPGETKASYTTPVLGVADTGRKYQVLASVPGLTQSSRVATVTVNADQVPPHLVTAAALPSQTGSTFDVGLTFDEPLDAVSAGSLANYTMSAGTPMAVKYYAGSPGVVLTVTGLTAGNSYSVTVTNVADPYGNHMTSANLPLTFSSLHWGVVGGDELQLGNGVLAVGPDAFDVYSDSIGAWGAYDEATFVYEQVTGDFDKELRVEYVDPASQWARSGLIVRDVPNFGVDRNGQTTNGLAGRYQKVHVQPVITAMGTAGANDYECNRRLDTGGQTDGPGGGGTPNYPNAWCRLQRVGQTFTKFRSDDGVNWVNIGVTTWGVDDVSKTPMPNTVYVGPDYAPENGNVSPAGLQAMFLTKFRDYRDHGVARPTLTITQHPDGTFTLTYTGTLYSSDTANSGYTPVSGATTPWPVNPKATGAKPKQFYQAR